MPVMTNNNLSRGITLSGITYGGDYSLDNNRCFNETFSFSCGSSITSVVSTNMSFLVSFISGNKIQMLSDSRQITSTESRDSSGKISVKEAVNDSCKKIAYVKENNSIFGLTGLSAIENKDLLNYICDISRNVAPKDFDKLPVTLRNKIVNEFHPQERIMNIHHGFFVNGIPHLFTYDIAFPSGLLSVSAPGDLCYSGDNTIANLFPKCGIDVSVPDAFDKVKYFFDTLIAFTGNFKNYPIGGHTEYLILQPNGQVQIQL